MGNRHFLEPMTGTIDGDEKGGETDKSKQRGARLGSASWGNSHSNRKGGLRQLLFCCYDLFILAGECRCNSWAELWRRLKDVQSRTWNSEVTYSFPVQTQVYSEGWRQLSSDVFSVLGTRDAYEKVSHPSPLIPHHLVKNIVLVNTYT